MYFVIVGGGGYVGYHVAVDLIIKGHSVTLFDISQPDREWVEDAEAVDEFRQQKNKLRFEVGNILSVEDMTKTMTGADCVVHCVSYGMSGREQMPSNWDKTELINIQGTKNVITAACQSGIRGMVYTSTFNVVFGGQEIHNGDESLPYFPLHRHVDHYSRTKSIAEQLVLGADGKQTSLTKSNGFHLRTCALRLAGVIGPKERRHLPRITSLWPMFRFRFGYGEALVQFAGIENIVQAHVKASLGLLQSPDVVGGQAYFISDGVPINSYEYFRPVIESMGHVVSSRKNVPMVLIWFGAYFIIFVYFLLHRVWDFCPLIAPAEIYKTGVTHYFGNEKAMRDFGYAPENPNDLSKVCQYYSEKKNK